MSGKRKVEWEGKYLRIVRAGNWEYVERCGGVHAVVILAEHEGNVVLVEQSRTPLGERTCLEMPAGLVGDEDPSRLVDGHPIGFPKALVTRRRTARHPFDQRELDLALHVLGAANRGDESNARRLGGTRPDERRRIDGGLRRGAGLARLCANRQHSRAECSQNDQRCKGSSR